MSTQYYAAWQRSHGYGEMTYGYWLGWYECRPSYTAGDETMSALDREAIGITAAGRDNFCAFREAAARIIAQWPRGVVGT